MSQGKPYIKHSGEFFNQAMNECLNESEFKIIKIIQLSYKYQRCDPITKRRSRSETNKEELKSQNLNLTSTNIN